MGRREKIMKLAPIEIDKETAEKVFFNTYRQIVLRRINKKSTEKKDTPEKK